jgi:response regulator RpfG family c-di-GMP phosphodiesterase
MVTSEQTREPVHVLVINADRDFLTAVGETLVQAQYRVTTMTANDASFLGIVRLAPDIIMLDFVLDNDAAWQLLGELDADLRTRSIPLVVTSVFPALVDAATARSSHRPLRAHLIKPLDLGALQTTVAAVLADAAGRHSTS